MADLIFTDEQIEALLRAPKRVMNPGARWKVQRGAEQRNLELESDDAKQFTLYLRQNIRLANNFSCGLLFRHPQGLVTLTRYNGSDHDHDNPLELDTKLVGACHIHVATERYMRMGRKPEHFAQITDRYNDLEGALRSLVEDCNITGVRLKDSDTAVCDEPSAGPGTTGDLFT